MLLTVSILLGFKKEIIQKITGLTTHIVVSNVNLNASNEPEPIRISEDTLKLLKNLACVKHIQKTAFKNGLLKTDTENEGILLKGVDNSYDFTFLNKHLSEGSLPDLKQDEASQEMLISEVLARKLNLKLNNTILVHFIAQREVFDSLVMQTLVKSEQRSRKFTICGIFKTDFADFDAKLSIVDIRQIQRLCNWNSDLAGNYEIMVHNFSEINENQEEIQDLLGYGLNVSNITELYSNIFIWLEKLDINGVIVIMLMVLVATVNMITALLILILERTNMIGLVKALGMSNTSVRKIFMFISIRLIGKGMLWGNIIGIGLCLIQYYFKLVKLNSETYYVDSVIIEMNWYYFLLVNAGTFLICTFMLLFPTIMVSKLSPVKTLKFD